MKKKTGIAIVFALALALVLTLIPMVSQAEKADVPSADPLSVWDGSVDTDLRTEGNTYYIDSAAELAGFAKLVNDRTNLFAGKTVKLTSDIALNDTSAWTEWTADSAPANKWPGIGAWSAGFQGTFDGQGHTISGVYMLVADTTKGNNWGFFRDVAGSAVIKNLNMKESAFFATSGASGSLNFGSLVGVVQNGTVSIENVNVSSVVSAPNKNIVGGIVGSLHADAADPKIIGCTFSGSVAAKDDVGGIVGIILARKATITNVAVNAAISGAGNVGGIVGRTYSSTSGNPVAAYNITSAVVSGTVTGVNQSGGIVGYVGISANLTLDSCVNKASVTITGAAAGGFVGRLSDDLNITVTFKDSANLGAIKSGTYAGGLFGSHSWGGAGGQSQKLTITNCLNLGTVTSTSADHSGAIISNFRGGNAGLTITNTYYSAESDNGWTRLATTDGNGTTAKPLAEIKAISDTDLAAMGMTNWKATADGPMPKAQFVPGAKTAAVDFAAIVALDGKTIAAGDFSVHLFKANASFVPEATALRSADNGSDGIADLGSVELTEGTHYFVMKQEKGTAKGVTYDEGQYNVSVTVDAFGNIMAANTVKAGVSGVPTSFSFKNTYTVSPSSLNVSAKVELTGRTLKAEEFSFALYKADDADFTVTAAQPVKTAKNDADGNVFFTEVEEYSAVGTHYYVLKQVNTHVPGVTPEIADYNITVTVADDNSQLKATVSSVKAGASAASEIVYKNTYKATPAVLTPAASVTLAGKTLTADLFSYGLYATGMDFKITGDPIATAKNAADGKIAIGNVTVSEKGTSYYVLKQNELPGEGYTASVTEYQITVTAADDGSGILSVSYTASKKGEAGASEIVFSNTYEKPVARIEKPADASVYEGTVSEALRTEGLNVYIDSAADLAKFADIVNNGTNFAGKTVLLTTDIVWNTGDAAKWAQGINPPGFKWTCGSWGKRFSGTFDGQGHTIYGLYGKSDTDNFGFISCANGTVTVKNLILANCAFVSTRNNTTANLGGVIGTLDMCKLTVDNVYAEIFLSAPAGTRVGGILGYCHRLTNTEVTITDTVFAGSVVGKNEVGGFVGYLTFTNNEDDKTVKLIVENCLNKGSVSGGLNVGGFVGYANDRILVTVTDSVNAGLITGTTKTGAIAGSCNVAPTLTDVYYLDVSAASAGTGLTAAAVSAEKLYGDAAKTNLTGLDFAAAWTVVADDVPMPKTVYQMLNPAAPGGEGDGGEGGNQEAKDPEAVPPSVTPSKDASVYNGTASKKLRTEGKTVYIDSAADLAYLAEKVTSGMSYAGKTIVLTADIIWNTGDADKWAAGSETPKYTWTFGKWNKFFQGTFDGNGHVISGLYNTSDGDNTGFIGAVSGNATVKNVAVVNSAFLYTGTKNANMGFIGVTGEKTTLTVDNCYADINLVAPAGSQVGGIVGRVHNTGCSAAVTNTVFAGTVTGNDGVGGIIGRADKGEKDETGAIVTIENCINLGSVTGNKNTAGFVGYNNKGTVTVKTSINAGPVACADAAATGAFFGAGTDSVTLTDCVYVIGTSLKATGADLKEGVVSVAAVSLFGDTAKTTLPKFNFKKDWSSVKDGYPLPASIVRSFGGGAAENNPATSDFVPAAFAVICILSAGAALLLLCKKKTN